MAYARRVEKNERIRYRQNTMKKSLLTFMLTVINTNAIAEWTIVQWSDSSSFTVYVDFNTIRKTDNKIKMWSLWDYKIARKIAEGEYSSVKTQWEYDCKEEQARLLAFSSFSGNMGKGNVVQSPFDSSPSGWRPEAPGSVGESLLKTACGRVIAEGTKWTVLGETDGSTHYVDPTTIRKAGNKVTMWDLVDYKKIMGIEERGIKYLSAKMQYEYDCKEEQMKGLAVSFFSKSMGAGQDVLPRFTSPTEWMAIEPGSIGEIKWKIACGKQ